MHVYPLHSVSLFVFNSVFTDQLNPVGNLTAFLISSTSVNISWILSPREITIANYRTVITNTTSEEKEEFFVENTSLVFSVNVPNPATNFSVTVIPVFFDVGEGEPETISGFLFLDLNPGMVECVLLSFLSFIS